MEYYGEEEGGNVCKIIFISVGFLIGFFGIQPLYKGFLKRVERKKFFSCLTKGSIVSTPMGIGHITKITNKYCKVEIVEQDGTIIEHIFKLKYIQPL